MRVPFRMPFRRRKKYENPSGVMSFTGHLIELRDRLLKSMIAVVLGLIVSFFFVNSIIDVIIDLIPAKLASGRLIEPIALKPTETFVTYFQVALVVGIVIALPVLVYQILAYVTPGLTPGEKGMLFRALPFVMVLFIMGASFIYFLVLPAALEFLLGFGDPRISYQLPISEFVGFVTNFVLVGGLIFQLPLIIYLLARLHVVNTRLLKKARRIMIVVCFITAAIITPTPDPVNQTIVAIPMYLLYELGIFLSRLVKN